MKRNIIQESHFVQSDYFPVVMKTYLVTQV